MNFFHLSHNSHFWCLPQRLDCNTAHLHQAMRSIVSLSLFVAFWYAIILVVRWCSIVGPHKSAVVLFDREYPSFGNFNSAILIGVVGMKSYMDSLFDPMCVPVGVTIIKLNLVPNRNRPRFVTLVCSETAEVWVRANRMSLSYFFFILSRTDILVSPI